MRRRVSTYSLRQYVLVVVLQAVGYAENGQQPPINPTTQPLLLVARPIPVPIVRVQNLGSLIVVNGVDVDDSPLLGWADVARRFPGAGADGGAVWSLFGIHLGERTGVCVCVCKKRNKGSGPRPSFEVSMGVKDGKERCHQLGVAGQPATADGPQIIAWPGGRVIAQLVGSQSGVGSRGSRDKSWTRGLVTRLR